MGSPLCRPPPISHIVSRSTCEHLRLILGDSAGLLQQNAQNSTVAPLMSCIRGLSSSVYSTMRRLPGVPEHEAVYASRSMAEAAFDAYHDEIQSVDPRMNPEHLQTLRQQDHNFRFLLADKNPGLLSVVCTVHWAQLFQTHILQNVKYQVLHAFGQNVVLVVAELGYKDVPQRHWRTRVLNFYKENQIPVGPADLMVMYDYGNFLRWG